MSNQNGKTVRWQSRTSVGNDALFVILPPCADLDNSDFAALPLAERDKREHEMRQGWAAGAVAIAAMTGAVAGHAQTARRSVTLITMNQPMPAGEAEPAEKPSDDPNEASTAESLFRVHDLSRRYVEYRMSQEMAAPSRAPTTAPAAPPVVNAVAPLSSIAVPGWMRRGAPAPIVTFTPGCAPAAYHPSGFLSAATERRRAAYYAMISAIACEAGIPVGLFDAMILRESGYDPLATSSKNAFGLAQLMPGTAAQLGVDRYDTVQNLRGGARYLRSHLDRFGQVHLALAAYNAGPGRVRGGMVPRIAETQAYVTNILANWNRLSGYARVATLEPMVSGQSAATRRAGATIAIF